MRAEVAEGALVLIVGGLFLVALVVVLVILRNLFPDPQPAAQPSERGVARRLAATERTAPASRAAPGSPRVADVDEGRRRAEGRVAADLAAALEVLADERIGDPRLLGVRAAGRIDVRLYRCGECRGEVAGASSAPGAACGVAVGLFEGVFAGLMGGRARVSEVACGRGGSRVCDFRVERPGSVEA